MPTVSSGVLSTTTANPNVPSVESGDCIGCHSWAVLGNAGQSSTVQEASNKKEISLALYN